MNIIETLKPKKDLIINILAVLAIVLTIVFFETLEAFAITELWDLKLGGKTIAVFDTKDKADAVIDGIETAYVKDGEKVKSVDIEPALTVEKQEYREKDIKEFADTQKTIDALKKNKKLKVTVESLLTEDQVIEFEKVDEKTKKLPKGETKLYRHGENGCDRVEYNVVSTNGKLVYREILSKETIKEPVSEVTLIGTKAKAKPTSRKSAPKAEYTGSVIKNGDGNAVAAFAKQFIGNPYRYGGSSLTNGSDCSGFVMSVYKNFGVSLPHGSYAMMGVGKGVSYSEAIPGDIICQGGHVGIYIGGGQMVHAVNPRMGIQITDVHYTGSVLAVRRVLG